MAARIVYALAALFLLGAAAAGTMFGGRYLLLGEKSIGIVIEIGEEGGMLYPVVEFRTGAGEVRRHRGLASDDLGYWVGQPLPIRYLPHNPAQSVISSSFQELWLLATVLGVIGAVLAGIGWIMGRMEPPPARLSQPNRSGRVKRARRRK